MGNLSLVVSRCVTCGVVKQVVHEEFIGNSSVVVSCVDVENNKGKTV